MLLPTVLPPDLSTLFRAVVRKDNLGKEAFAKWRANTPLNDINGPAFRMLPILAEAAKNSGAEDLGRMNGVARYIWVANMLQLKALSQSLGILRDAHVPVMVIKGAALFARDPNLAKRRVAADYDILVPSKNRIAAAEALQRAGFRPGQGFSWAEVKYGMHDRSGAPVSDGHGEIDLHWRPLQQIHDEALSRSFEQFAEPGRLKGLDVTVPSVTDHLFATLARAEPSEPEEAFYRLYEAAVLIENWPQQIDWGRLASTARRYNYEARIQRFLSVLAHDGGLQLPPAALAIGLAASAQSRWEEALRARPEAERSPAVRWFLAHRDRTSSRRDAGRPPARLAGALALQLRWLTHRELRDRWRDAVYLEQSFPARGLRFGPGFSSNEKTGRWTDGAFAALRTPMPADGSRAIALHAMPFLTNRRQATVVSFAGAGVRRHQVATGASPTEITIELRPLSELGGDALILFYLDFARSPFSAGTSADVRQLGLFLPRATTEALGPQAPND